MATKKGLYRVRGGEIELVSGGQFYGVAKAGRQLLAFRWGRTRGTVWAFDRHPSRGICVASRVISDLSPGVHQIDLSRGLLYLCDTYNNALRTCSATDPSRARIAHPVGRLAHGRDSQNYAHINSVYVTPGRVYLVCHNESAKTGRPSEILILDDGLAVVDRRECVGRSVHNVVPTASGLLYCDSLGGRLMLDDQPVFEPGWFTRGLSITRDYVVVGGSDYADRSGRSTSNGYLAVLDRKSLTVRAEIRLPGMVQEIRCLDDLELGASEGWYEAASCYIGANGAGPPERLSARLP